MDEDRPALAAMGAAVGLVVAIELMARIIRVEWFERGGRGAAAARGRPALGSAPAASRAGSLSRRVLL